ncbi:MAG: hypothetical protein ACLSVG_01795 [Clostridia bacterium]
MKNQVISGKRNKLSFINKKHQYNGEEEMIPINLKLQYYIGLSTDYSTAKEVRLFGMKDNLISRYKALYNETLSILKRVFNINRNVNCAGTSA